jgi:hypothetical protein
MKLRRTRLSLFIVVLMLAAQITVAPSTARAAQNMAQDHSQHMGIPDSRCRRRCSNEYRRCLRRGKNRRACARQLRNCQRRCPQ